MDIFQPDQNLWSGMLGISNRQVYRMLQTLQALLCGHSLAGNVKRRFTHWESFAIQETPAVQVTCSGCVTPRTLSRLTSVVSSQFSHAASLTKWEQRVVTILTIFDVAKEALPAASDVAVLIQTQLAELPLAYRSLPIALRVGAS